MRSSTQRLHAAAGRCPGPYGQVRTCCAALTRTRDRTPVHRPEGSAETRLSDHDPVYH
jgi:hypothetical protein